MSSIHTALVPCAGLGTRLLPMTRVVPKELLPYEDRPLIQHVLEELHEAGIRRAVLVTRPDKDLLQRHLVEPYPFEGRASCPAPVPEGMEVRFAEQPRPDGLAGALLAARAEIDGPFLLVFPDQLLPGASRRLVDAWSGEDSLSALVRIPAGEAGFFTGARGLDVTGEPPLYEVAGLLHEVTPDRLRDAQGEVRAFGRTILREGFLGLLESDPADESFGRAFERHLRHGVHRALLLEGTPVDVGTRAGYRRYAGGRR